MKTANKIEPISLINGLFESEEAKEVLYTLFSDKIKFHQNRIFRLEEKYGEIDERSKKRVEELKKSREKLLLLLQEMNSISSQFQISCDIKIKAINEH
jgi:hypothetical protein